MEKAVVATLVNQLIGSMTLEEFNSTIRERESRKFGAAFEPSLLTHVFSIDTLEQLLAENAIPANYVDVIKGGLPKRLDDLQRGSGKSSPTCISESLRRGATIRASDVQRFHSGLQRFVDEVTARFSARSQINLYVTPTHGTGFGPHFDTTDIFIVQILGAKSWRIFRDYTGRVDLPLLETPWDPEAYQPSAEFETLPLVAGDVLYLPRGTMHQAFCTNRPSLDLTVSIAPLVVADILIREVKRLADRDVSLRKRIVWSLDDVNADRQQLARHVRERLSELVSQVDAARVLAAEQLVLQEPQQAVHAPGTLMAALVTPTQSKAES